MGATPSPFVVVVHGSDGRRVTGHETRKAAREQGRALRSAGANAYVFPTVEAIRLGIIECAPTGGTR